jgi:hypothetical protein
VAGKGKYIDFDAAVAEAAQEPVVVRYQGREWTLYSSIPARPVLRLLRLRAEGRDRGDLSQGEMMSFMAEMVPAEVLEAWLDGGMTVDEMSALLSLVTEAYNAEDASAEGEAPAAAAESGPTPSSSTGPR